ncbi:hypothetical protein Airi02_037510 [Actinoallomurus iriomotensis]|uniref:Uncharacterized protein n=1 Tax=Actinoallomurus iriomotensis TaxID=478107 RepID=A0A9W6W0J2_9ACTN|nr:hypothetical protein Airi02_037510 [Actinoallomurus iriomotensis]
MHPAEKLCQRATEHQAERKRNDWPGEAADERVDELQRAHGFIICRFVERRYADLNSAGAGHALDSTQAPADNTAGWRSAL